MMSNYGMMDAGNLLYQFGTAIAGIAAVVAVIFGIVECYFGYRLFKIIMAITGFFVGFGLGMALGFGIIMQSGGSGGLAIVLALAGGIIGVLIAVKVYYLGVFLYGFSVGFLVVLLFEGPSAAGVVLGIIAGVLLVIFSRLLIIISTAIAGGVSLGAGIGLLLYSSGISISSAVTILLSVFFIVTGLYFQFKANGGLPSIAGSHKKEERADTKQKPTVSVTSPKGLVRYCEECGTEFEEGSAFCSSCGKKIESA